MLGVFDLRRALIIAGRDLRQWRRDRLGFLYSLGFPIAFATGFFFILSTALTAPTASGPVTIALATQESDSDSISRQIIDSLAGVESSWVTYPIWDHNEALQAVESGQLPGFIEFGSDFSQRLSSGQGSAITVHVGPDSNTGGYLEATAEAIAADVNLRWVSAAGLVALAPDRVVEIAAAALRPAASAPLAPSFEISDFGSVDPPNPGDITIPGYLVMFVFMAALFTATSMAIERESGSLARMVAAGAGPAAIISGKFLATAVRGTAQVVILGLFGVLAFGIDLGSAPLVTVAVALMMVFVSAAFAILLSALVRTERATVSAAVLTALVAAPLGGCWWPLYILPEWMARLALITPHGWANTAFNQLMLFGGDLRSVTDELMALVAFALGFLLLALWRFRNAPLVA